MQMYLIEFDHRLNEIINLWIEINQCFDRDSIPNSGDSGGWTSVVMLSEPVSVSTGFERLLVWKKLLKWIYVHTCMKIIKNNSKPDLFMEKTRNLLSPSDWKSCQSKAIGLQLRTLLQTKLPWHVIKYSESVSLCHYTWEMKCLCNILASGIFLLEEEKKVDLRLQQRLRNTVSLHTVSTCYKYIKRLTNTICGRYVTLVALNLLIKPKNRRKIKIGKFPSKLIK